jgi:hypothetical protein
MDEVGLLTMGSKPRFRFDWFFDQNNLLLIQKMVFTHPGNPVEALKSQRG